MECNTKKDSQVESAYCRHYALVLCSEHATSLTGILAGIWPCGIITLLDEIFVNQVYGSVYSLLHSNPQKTSEISIYKCIFGSLLTKKMVHTTEFLHYDDGCHLRMFTKQLRGFVAMEIVIEKMQFKGYIDP